MIDIVAPHLPAIPPPGGLIYAPEGISVNVGGHAANASIDLAGLGQGGVAAAGCVGDDMLGPHRLKAGASFFVSVYGIQRSARDCDEPARFWPERFTEERARSRHPFAFLPFGSGPRV